MDTMFLIKNASVIIFIVKIACIQNCLSCSSNTTCQNCEINYFVNFSNG